MSADRPMGILQRSADLVELLAERGPLSPADIGEAVDTPRSSVYRLADALRETGLTEQLADSRIKLSLRWHDYRAHRILLPSRAKSPKAVTLQTDDSSGSHG